MSETTKQVKNDITNIMSEITELTSNLDIFIKNIEFMDNLDQMMLYQQVLHLKYLTKILTKLQNAEDLEKEIDLKHYIKN